MIYLKVRGGLCNRMRAMDSLVSLCQKYQRDLTILWPKDVALNSGFEELFDTYKIDSPQFRIINCPPGYPETYFPTIKNELKNLVKGRKLNNHLNSIAKTISKLPNDSIMTEVFLDNHYNTIIAETQGKVGEMDNLFCERLDELTKTILKSKGDAYINSCYRLNQVEGNYELFIPTKEIMTKIEQTASKFDNTFGLHIRRSDHEASKKYSTLDKFTNVMDKELTIHPKATFFLSTDDEITKGQLIEKYGEKILYNVIDSYDRNSPEAVKGAVLDLFCLSKTKKLFGSHHSSFSQVAAQIGGIQEITVK